MKNTKKAIIGLIMLGFLVIFSSVIFIGTLSDKLTVTNKVAKIRKILQTASLSAAKYYMDVNNSTIDAENVARGIISQTSLGAEINSNINFTWDSELHPTSLIVKLPSYIQDLFWFKFLGWNDKNITNMASKANIVNDPTIEEVNDFLPIAINGCDQEFSTGDELNYLLKAHDIYSNDDYNGFFALAEPGGGQSSFTHFTNVINKLLGQNPQENIFNINTDVNISNVDAEDIHNDVMQIATAFDISKFVPHDMSISVLTCDSTATNIKVEKILPISMTAVYCADECCINMMGAEMCSSMFCLLTNISEYYGGDIDDPFGDKITWSTTKNDCNQNELFRIQFEVLDSQETNVILEY